MPMNKDLLALLEAESRYLTDAGWQLSRDISHVIRTLDSPARMTLWVSPHNGDEYAQPAAVRQQKVEDGYLPRQQEAPHRPASTL